MLAHGLHIIGTLTKPSSSSQNGVFPTFKCVILTIWQGKADGIVSGFPRHSQKENSDHLHGDHLKSTTPRGIIQMLNLERMLRLFDNLSS